MKIEKFTYNLKLHTFIMALHLEISMKSMLGLAASSSCKWVIIDTKEIITKSQNNRCGGSRIMIMRRWTITEEYNPNGHEYISPCILTKWNPLPFIVLSLNTYSFHHQTAIIFQRSRNTFHKTKSRLSLTSLLNIAAWHLLDKWSLFLRRHSITCTIIVTLFLNKHNHQIFSCL